MSLIHDDYRLQVMDTPQKLNFSVQLPLGVTAIEFGLTAQLLQQTFVKVSGGQLGIGQVQNFE
jgi:hypothetical protein